MVAVVVRVDYGADRKALATVLLEELPTRPHNFRGHRDVEDNPAGAPAHERNL